MPACDGARMPNGSVLPDQYIQCVADWITSLGQNGCEMCGGTACASLSSDAGNCGTCGNVCPQGTSCLNGACLCPSGQSACGSACVDETVDSQNCGACGNACPAGASCSGGQCQCAGSLMECGSGCFDVSSDSAHCGNCNTACTTSQVCLNGACASGCGALTQCGSSCVDLQTSVTDCGACNKACAAGLTCAGGTCGCATGLDLCGTSCTDLKSDESNCGACGLSCGPGATCSNGVCQCGATSISFQSDLQPIFTSSCTNAGCHSGMKPKEGMSLESGKAYDALVGVTASQCGGQLKRVKAGDVGQSYLMDKLLGVNVCTGTQMPKPGASLAAPDLAKISDWICQGAKRN